MFASKKKSTKAYKSDQEKKPEENLRNDNDKRQQQLHVCVISCRFSGKSGVSRSWEFNSSAEELLDDREEKLRNLASEKANLEGKFPRGPTHIF